MTNIEILKKAVEKVYKEAKEASVIESNGILRVDIYAVGKDFPYISAPYQCIIFSHDFAQDFWNNFHFKCLNCNTPLSNDYNKSICPKCNIPLYPQYVIQIPGWQYHLQQMVLEPEPIKYLEKFL